MMIRVYKRTSAMEDDACGVLSVICTIFIYMDFNMASCSVGAKSHGLKTMSLKMGILEERSNWEMCHGGICGLSGALCIRHLADSFQKRIQEIGWWMFGQSRGAIYF